jgi:hypothetical protein
VPCSPAHGPASRSRISIAFRSQSTYALNNPVHLCGEFERD